jgi:cysteine desulfurase / selenocysteine lyase
MIYATKRLGAINEVRLIGLAPEKEPMISFVIDGFEMEKLATFLNDHYNIEVKAGDQSAQPLMKKLGVKSLLRASFCYYNTKEEIDIFTDAVCDFIQRKS